MNLLDTTPAGMQAYIGAFSFGDIPTMTKFSCSLSAVGAGFDIEGVLLLQEVDLPNLVTIDVAGTQEGYLWVSGSPVFTTLNVPLLSSISFGLTIQDCASITSLSFPSLVAPYSVSIQNCANLVSISLPVWVPENVTHNFSGCALNAATVNLILARGVANPAFSGGGAIDLTGGTNSPPTGQGITDAATLNGRGAVILTN